MLKEFLQLIHRLSFPQIALLFAELAAIIYGFFFMIILVLKAAESLVETLHIKKIGLSGLECSPDKPIKTNHDKKKGR